MTTETFGRYEIKSELGRGGMATVYNAYDPSFERNVAIKVLPQAFLHDPEFRTRFQREAKMIALLEHPTIVPVYDFGEHAEQPYIVMRFMSGGSLADRLKQGPIAADETARIISRLAPALDAAHARGIVHRDLKPGNILFDQYGNAFLSDFGIARLTQEGSATLTGSNIVGTPAYMSPEQVRGEKAVDGRSDLYALGVLAFQMLSGQAPYHSDTPTKLMMMHLLEPIPDIRQSKTDLPETVQAVIGKQMAKDPDDRFQTAADFAEALEKSLRGEMPVFQPAADATMMAGATRIVRRDSLQNETPALATVVAARQDIPSSPPPLPAQAKRPRWLAIALPVLAVVCLGLVVVGVLSALGLQGNGPLAMLARPTATPTPAPTQAPTLPSLSRPAPTGTQPPVVPAQLTPTSTPPPTEEPTATEPPLPSPTITPTEAPQVPILGGADKIAFLNGRNLWVANLDGSALQQLTTDGTLKTDLSWTPDGQALTYITGKCIQSVQLENGRIDNISCFNFVDFLTGFALSPDMSQVAISLDNQLYIVPYNLASLNQVANRNELIAMATCKDMAPYGRNAVKQARWSRDGRTLAAMVIGVKDGIRADIIQLLNISECVPNPPILDNFPPPRFEMAGYEISPNFQNFGWDGLYLFTLNNNIRNDGFGDLYIYNTDLHKVQKSVNPVDQVCCYRDASWSPDGNYLVVAFQDLRQGSGSVTQLYLIPYGSLGTGATYIPLPLPALADVRERPQAVLRPVQ
jgi:serine/threonine protein kinase